MAEDETKKSTVTVDEQTPAIELEAKEETAPAADDKTAKAGKRSSKALKEAEEKVAKEERKATGDTTPQSDEAKASADKKGPAPKTRPRLERRSKNYRKSAEQIEKNKAYTLAEAVTLATKTNPVKFDATVEMHFNLNVDPRQADQNIRATVTLPNGTGKSVRVAVFAPAAKLDAAKKAGADLAGEEEFLQLLDKEQLDFDILIATPQMMPRLGKYARLLGPRGLMPNPKSGTVTTNLTKAVEEAKAGRVEYRVDKQGIVHQGIGKVSFDAAKLTENAKAFVASVNSVKPNSIKGAYIKSLTVTTTMGPGIKVDINSL